MNVKRLSLIILLLGTLACSSLAGAAGGGTETEVASAGLSESGTATQTPAPATATTTPLPVVPTPVYISPDCAGQRLATIPPATTVAEPTLSLGANPPLTTDQQLAVFDDLASTLNDVYVYPDFNGQDWPSVTAAHRAKVQSGLGTEAFYAEMQAYVSALGDDHSYFESPLDVAATAASKAGNNSFVGIGVYVLPVQAKDYVTVLGVLHDSAAEHSGLKLHDDLLTIDGLPLVENGVPYPQRLLGPECSAVVLTVQSPGESPRDITLVRSHVNAPIPISAQLVPTTDGSRIGYIFVPTLFDETIPDQVRQALEDFGPLDGLILDNRMNGGGEVSVMDPVLGYFTSGTVGHYISRTTTEPVDITADPINNSQTVPMVVLVGTDTVSLGEISSGVLQDIGRASVVGQTTLGNVEGLKRIALPDGSEAWIAELRFDPIRSHADWEKTGIIPDVQVKSNWDTVTLETDPVVAAALTLLGHQ